MPTTQTTTHKHVSFNVQDQISTPICYPAESSSDEEDGTVVDIPSEVDMSEFMRTALATPWDVFYVPTPKFSDKPAFADRGVSSIRMEFKPSFLPGDLEVKLPDGSSFISVADVYNGIKKYLDTVIDVTDPIFKTQERKVREEIQSAFQARTRRKFTGHVKYVDLLRRDRLLKGITIESVLERWVVKFGPEGDSES